MKTRRKHYTFWDLSEIFPPIVCRILARQGGKGKSFPLTTGEIALRGKLDSILVITLSRTKTWDNVPLALMRKYLIGCGVDFCDARQMHRHANYLKISKGVPKYLRQSPDWRTFYEPLIKEWQRR